MARDQRYDVDYFPHECTHGRKMHIIETKYGNDGYAAWFKLLEQLGKANNHYLDISDEMNLMFLISIFKVEKDTAISILEDLAKLDAIDKYLYDNHRIIYSKKFIESIRDAYRKRKSKIFEYSDLLNQIESKNGQSTGRNPKTSGQTGGSLPEDIPKEENRIEEESKVEKNKAKYNSLLSEIKISDVEDDLKKYFEIAVAFQKLFIKNLSEKKAPTNHQEKATFKNYVDPIRLMLQNDGVTLEQLQCVFKYLQSPQGEFWKANILSTKKLREKFSQLVIKSKENGIKVNNNNRTDEELMQAASDAVNRMFGQ